MIDAPKGIKLVMREVGDVMVVDLAGKLMSAESVEWVFEMVVETITNLRPFFNKVVFNFAELSKMSDTAVNKLGEMEKGAEFKLRVCCVRRLGSNTQTKLVFQLRENPAENEFEAVKNI